MDRAYSILTVKAVEEEHRIIRGVATSPTADRVGDIVEPLGVKFTNPSPLLWQHKHDAPVGTVKFDRPTAKGVTFEARLAKIDEPGPLKDRVDEAWQSVKAGLVRAVSIGFRSIERAFMDGGGIRFSKVEVLELSLVTIPANADATITTIKSADRRLLAASGRSGKRDDPAVSGASKSRHERKPVMDTIDNQVADLEERRTELVTEMKGFGDVTDLDDDQAKEYDAVAKEFEELETKLARAKRMQRAVSGAKPIDGSSIQRGAESRARVPAQPKAEVEKGIRFARYVLAMAKGRGHVVEALEHAKRWNNETPEVGQMIKAVAGSTSTASGAWGSELVEPITREFMELLMPATIVGRIDGFDRMPFNTRIIEQTAGGTVNWVGELDVKPVGEMAFSEITLPYHKIAGIVVLSDELVRLSTPSAEQRVRTQLVRDIAKFMDQQFLDISVSATADHPASVTNGITPTPASGTDADAFYVDLNTALAGFDTAEINGPLAFITTQAVARGLSTLRNPLGQSEFPGMNAQGGTLSGYQWIVSNSAPSATITILAPGEIALADDGGVTIDASREATLDMAGGASPNYNLWQRNAVGIRAERWITWLKKRDAAVAQISGAAYAPSVASA